MLTLNEFKKNIFAFFRVMTSTGAYIDLAYKGRAYRMYLEDLGVDVPLRKEYKKRVAPVVPIETSECPQCRGMAINGVCTSPRHDLAKDKPDLAHSPDHKQ